MPVDVIAIGASLGGIEALKSIFAELPAELPAAVAVVQHRGADSTSMLVNVLASHARFPIVEPDDKARVVAGRAYLAPAGYHLLLEPGRFALSVQEPVCFARPSIDVLFESLADAYGDRGGCIVLTGSSEDGARGAAAVKRNGGRVLVQEPKDAVSPVAPLAVLAHTAVDGVVPLEEVPIWMCRWCGVSPAGRGGRVHALGEP